MPSSDAVLRGLSATANEWRTVAVFWHVLVAALLLAVATRRSLPHRLAGYLLVLPLMSVSGFAWVSGNPFNGAVFAVLGLLLSRLARALPSGTVSIAPAAYVVPGSLLVAFGWVYPHFLEATHWTAYLLAAPLGLLPCPTLSAVIGFTLMLDLRRSTAWSITLAAAGFVYGAMGVFGLGVTMDVGLLAGAVLLAGAAAGVSAPWRSIRADQSERTRRLPGDDLIPEPFGVLTHAITIRRAPRDVWPWLAQMGAGSRAGWYSYDVLDNGRRPSATRIIPELQSLAVGMIFPALPGVTDCFTLLAFEPERLLVLGWLLPDRTPRMTWAFILDGAKPGSTRLIVRARGGSGYHFHWFPLWLTKRLVPLIHFVMQRKQLRGIAHRAEYQPAMPSEAGRAPITSRSAA